MYIKKSYSLGLQESRFWLIQEFACQEGSAEDLVGCKGQAAEGTQQPIAAALGKAGIAEGQGGWAGSPWHSSGTQGKCPGGLHNPAIA